MRETEINCSYVTWPDGRRMAQGVKSIAALFGVGYSTALKYKNTFLKPAIVEREKNILVDIDKAIELYTKSEECENDNR